MDGTQLASALAERLAQVLPEGFSISSQGHWLWLDTRVVDGALELWYGDEGAPVIRFQPIKLRD